MSDKTKQELELEIALTRCREMHKTEFDNTYASKLVERVVWGMVGIILTAVMFGIVALVVK